MSLMIRITEASIIEEPGAGKPHAGICVWGPGNRYPYHDEDAAFCHRLYQSA